MAESTLAQARNLGGYENVQDSTPKTADLNAKLL